MDQERGRVILSLGRMQASETGIACNYCAMAQPIPMPITPHKPAGLGTLASPVSSEACNPSFMTQRRCTACRLPVNPHMVFRAQVGTQHAIVAICQRCATRLSSVPFQSVKRAVHRAAAHAAEDPARFWFACFNDEGPAQIVHGMLHHPEFSAEASELIGWIANPTKPNTSPSS